MFRSISLLGVIAALVALLLVSPYGGSRKGNPASATAAEPAAAAASVDPQQAAIDTLAAWPGAAGR